MNAMKRHGLNRGLSALFEESGGKGFAGASSGRPPGGREPFGEGTEMPVDLIDPNPRQPRKRFPDVELNALAQSIAVYGIVQPLLLRPSPSAEGRFEIVAGERRWRAAQRAGVHTVPASVRELTDGEMLQIALVENLQRSDLNPVEEARGYRDLMQEFDHKQADLAGIVGRSRAHIANTLRLLQLPESVLVMLEEGELSAGHARPLIGRSDAKELAGRIVSGKLSVREAEALASRRESRKPKGRQSKPVKDPDTIEMEDSLSTAFGCKVAIADRNGRGEIRITYSDYEELDRIAGRLTGVHLGGG